MTQVTREDDFWHLNPFTYERIFRLTAWRSDPAMFEPSKMVSGVEPPLKVETKSKTIPLSVVNRHIASRLRDARQRAGLTQLEFGRKFNLSALQIQRYEAGVNSVSAAQLFHFARLLETDISDFFTHME